VFVFVGAVILSGYFITERMLASDVKARISRLRSDLKGASLEMAAYRKLDAEANLLKQPIDFMNKQNSSLNPATALASLTLPAESEFSIKGITVQNGEAFWDVKIEGNIKASGFSETQVIYERIIDQMGKLAGYTVLSSSVDVKTKTFVLQARYNGIGKQVK
jgi:hypothetical protein